MNDSIFHAYDIRGIYPYDLDEHDAYRIGCAVVKFLKPKQVIIGRDIRKSSERIEAALICGITDQGVDVIDIGLSSTPMLYFSIANYKIDAGINVTASHNPAQYNGLKICKEKAIPLFLEGGLEDIKRIAKEHHEPVEIKGNVEKKDVLEDYKNHVLKFKKDIKPFNVVIDTGNGMVGYICKEIFENLPINVTPLFFEPDGNFPNHSPDPTVEENLVQIKAKVKENKSDLGIAFDGDGDRVVLIDEKGNHVRGDIITAIIAEEILQDKKDEVVFYDLRSSKIVKETIEKFNCKAMITRVGHSFIKKNMRDYDAIFAGELSGHYYFRDNFTTDSGIIAAIHVLNYLSRTNLKLSEAVEKYNKYFHTKEINFEVKHKNLVLKKLEYEYKDGKISKIDGIMSTYDDWWFNVRKSNTEPLIRLNLEANTKEKMEEKFKEISDIIKINSN